MKKKQLLSLILSVVMIMTTIMTGITVNAAQSSASGGSMPFEDVPVNSWYFYSVQYVYDAELMNGTSVTKFTPEGILNRAMFVTILGRIARVDQSKYPDSSFKDVKTGQWYSAYIEWAYKKGITQGIGDGKFGLENPVTREQMATFIARYVGREGLKLPDDPNPVAGFKDERKVSLWAKDGLELMRKSGIIKGDDKGNCNPQAYATRAQGAAIFERLNRAVESVNAEPCIPSNVKINEVVNFGRYPQTSKGDDWTDIKWIVLDIKDGNALLLSKYALDCQPYNKSYDGVTWETCTLRKWLNNDFINKAFSEYEQESIIATEVENLNSYWGHDKDGDWYGNNDGKGFEVEYQTNGGCITNDQIFLLSLDEAQKYLKYEKQYLENGKGRIQGMQAACTDYACTQGASRYSYYTTSTGEDCCWWWLRSLGIFSHFTSNVRYDGYVFYNANITPTAVRPALWVKLES